MKHLVPDGEYEVSYSSEYDNGYGVESAADEVTIVIQNGTVESCTAYGMHFVTELDCVWDVNIYDDECLELIQAQCIPQGWSFSVKHPVLYSETNRHYLSGWIDAQTKEQAINKVCDFYQVEDDKVEVSHCGPWADLLKDIQRGD
jgi:hypothetical protein